MLKSISVVCSERSAEDFPRFRDIVRRYSQFRDVNLQILARQGSRVVLLPADECDTADCVWDFEAFDDLHCAVQGVIHALRRQGASDREIMIDFTGGQKVTSIVAATATYDLAVKAQYVQTNDPWSVRSYDVVIDRTDAGGLN